MRPLAERFGANLQAARKAAGISQEVLGFRSGLHYTTVGLMERGEQLPRVDSLVKLCGALEVEYAVLLVGLYWTPPERLGGGFGVATANR